MLDSVKATIERYWFFLSTLLIAILSFFVYRQSSKIGDLQQQIMINKLHDQLEGAVSDAQTSQENYEKSIQKYRDLRSHYDHFFGQN